MRASGGHLEQSDGTAWMGQYCLTMMAIALELASEDRSYEDAMDSTDRGIMVYGTLWCSDCKRSKRFFGEQRVRYAFVDVDQDAEGLALVERVNGGEHYHAWAVLLALGSTYRRLGIPGERDFIGAGVHFCATEAVA